MQISYAGCHKDGVKRSLRGIKNALKKHPDVGFYIKVLVLKLRIICPETCPGDLWDRDLAFECFGGSKCDASVRIDADLSDNPASALSLCRYRLLRRKILIEAADFYG